MDTAVFNSLVDNAFDEVARRDPELIPRLDIRIPVATLEFVLGPSSRSVLPAQDMQRHVDAGLSRLRRRGLNVALSSSASDRDGVGEMLLASIVDAAAAAHGLLPLRTRDATRQLRDVLASHYRELTTKEGVRFIHRRNGDRPLLVVNAIGLPIDVWSRFLDDAVGGREIVMVESPACNLLQGGMRGVSDIVADANAMEAVLEETAIDKFDLLAWCNGSRAAIELAARHPHRVRSLTLLAATLSGVRGYNEQRSSFEVKMAGIFESIAQQPDLAFEICKLLKDPAAIGIGSARAEATDNVFQLPAKEQIGALLAPMIEPDSLINYGRRFQADVTYPLAEKLSAIRVPLLLVTGSHDNIINNEHTMSAVMSLASSAVHAHVYGGGHYIQDLQYPYLRLLLDKFTGCGELAAAARLQSFPRNRN